MTIFLLSTYVFDPLLLHISNGQLRVCVLIISNKHICIVKSQMTVLLTVKK